MEMLYLNKKQYYVYRHYVYNEDGSENIFYIGKGIGDRIYNQNRNLYWNNIVKDNKGKYYVDIIQYCDNEDEAYKLENELQEYYWSIGQCRGCADVRVKKCKVKPIRKKTTRKKPIYTAENKICEMFDNICINLVDIPSDYLLIKNKKVDYKLLFKLISCGINLHDINKYQIVDNEKFIKLTPNSVYKSFSRIRKCNLMTYDYDSHKYNLLYKNHILLNKDMVRFMGEELNSNEIKIFIYIALCNLNGKYKILREELVESIGYSKLSEANLSLITDITNKLHNYGFLFKNNNYNEINKVTYHVDDLLLDQIKE